MKRDEILTRSQDQRFNAENVSALKKLVAAPQVKDMIREVKLGSYPNYDKGGSWGRLSLTKKGLVEQTGYWDWSSNLPDYCSATPNDSYKNDPKVVRPSMRLVKEYDLVESQLDKLLAKLKA